MAPGGTHGHHDDAATVGKTQVGVQDRSEGVAHEAGQREHQHDAEALVAVFADCEQQPEVTGQGQQQAGMGQVQHH